jgi:hypothetical protein
LSYLDDSAQAEWQVICAVLIPADQFVVAELMSALTIENLIPEDRVEKFVEFHAAELYFGHGAFEGLDQAHRSAAVANLLQSLSACDARVAYGAVNLKAHRKGQFGSAMPQDVAFRRCVLGVGQWLLDQIGGNAADEGKFSALFIMDEAANSDKPTQAQLQKSYRQMRARYRFSEPDESILPFHDDMYFGDSRYSLGIQLADLCGYFIARHLAGEAESEGFYRTIERYIISAGKDQ